MIINPAEYAGAINFIWFFGVVEDLHDPLYLGRVRVRCFGWHGDDKAAIPTNALPWAQVLMPSTSASVSGIGQSPTGIVCGSWVLGFFLDGERCQQPMVLGTFHGIPQNLPNPTKGFNDPEGVYPRSSDEADTNRLARTQSEADTHLIMLRKRESRLLSIPTANRYKLSSVTPDKGDEAYQTTLWEEPAARGGARSVYPRNKVTETESGHVFEVDDTPGGARIHEYHASGTYREIINNGTLTQKIMGDRYTIIASDDQVFINGDCNVTITGACRLRVNGDLVQEIVGDHHLTVHGNRYTKIIGNDVREIGGSESGQINGNVFLRIKGNHNLTAGGEENVNIGGPRSAMVGGDDMVFTGKKMTLTGKDVVIISTATLNIGSGTEAAISGGTQLKLRNLTEINNSGADIKITSGAGMQITAVGTILIDGAIVSINP